MGQADKNLKLLGYESKYWYCIVSMYIQYVDEVDK